MTKEEQILNFVNDIDEIEVDNMYFVHIICKSVNRDLRPSFVNSSLSFCKDEEQTNKFFDVKFPHIYIQKISDFAKKLGFTSYYHLLYPNGIGGYLYSNNEYKLGQEYHRSKSVQIFQKKDI